MSNFLEYGEEDDENCIKNIFGRTSTSSSISSIDNNQQEEEEKQEKQEEKQENEIFLTSYEINKINYNENNENNENYKIKIEIETNKLKGIAHQLWPASFLLCNYIENNFNQIINSNNNNNSHNNTEIIELGAGVGLCGIVLSILGCNYVTITDLPEAIELISKNIERNYHHISSSSCSSASLSSLTTNTNININSNQVLRSDVLRWGIDEDYIRYPLTTMENLIVIASDCVYWEHLYEPFFQTLDYFITTHNATVILSHFKRWKKEKKFFAMCQKKFQVEILYENIEVVPIGDEHIISSIIEDNDSKIKITGNPQTRKQISRIYRMKKK